MPPRLRGAKVWWFKVDTGRLQDWWARVEAGNWGGLHFQHAALCARRAWLFNSGVRVVNEHMRQAMSKHDTAYSRDKSTVGLMGLSPDRILWAEQIVEEHKTRRAHQDCARAQALFYAGGLSAATGTAWTARITDLTTRKKENLLFTSEALTWLEQLSDVLEAKTVLPPCVVIPACKACSYHQLCFGEANPSFDLEL